MTIPLRETLTIEANSTKIMKNILFSDSFNVTSSEKYGQ